ncbi:MAG: hypothetical protein IJR51_03025 [Clostridia bacterium]|nr:hypothetical protein [Clostridia bacterium]
MTKKMRSVFSVLLAAALLLCVCAVPVGAAEQPLYVVLGDSIAYGSGLSNPTEAVYGRIVADTNRYAYENYAVPGHTTANLLRRLENDTVSAAVGRADIISISIGGNNFLLGDLNGILYDGIVKEDFARLDEITATFYEDLGTIVSTVRALNPKAAILLQTLYNPQTGYIGDVYQQGADRLNGAIRRFAAANPGEILIVEVAQVLTDSDRDFAEDRIHPSAAGNEKIARAVLRTLCDNGLGSETEPVINAPGKDARGAGMFTTFVNLYGRFFHVLAVIRNILRGLVR